MNLPIFCCWKLIRVQDLTSNIKEEDNELKVAVTRVFHAPEVTLLRRSQILRDVPP